MYQSSGFQVGSEPQRSQVDPKNHLAVLKFLSIAQVDEALAENLSESLEIDEFQLGDLISNYVTSDGFEKVVYEEQNEQSDQYLYLVCQGRVRLLGFDPERQQDVSVQVLEEGEAFGGDRQFCQSSMPYRAIAASAGQVAKIPLALLESWLEKSPQLQDFLQQQARQRERLIFFKTHTTLGSRSASKKEALTSNQIQQLLAYIVEIHIPKGTLPSQTSDCASGYFWLRQGEIYCLDDHSLTVGESWGYSEATTVNWVAETDVVLYKLPIEHWESVASIAPKFAEKLTSDAPANGPVVTSSHLVPVNPTKSGRKPKRPSLIPFRTSSHTVDLPRRQGVHSEPVSILFPKPRKQRRQGRFWQNYPFIQQQSSSDCGVACLAMITQYWGKRFSLNSLRNFAKVGRSGASLKNLAIAAETIGFHSQPVRASFDRLTEQKKPWIAHWQGDHYVVVYQIRGNQILIADPARGKRTLTRQAFLANWTGYALLLDPTDELFNTETQTPSLNRFWSLLGAYPSVLGQIILISLLIQVFGLITPLFTQIILDRVVTQKSLITLHVFVVGLLLFSVWRVGLTGIRQYLLDYFSNRIDLTLISGFISHALRLPLQFFESRHVGDILTRVQENQKIQLFLVRQAVSTWLDGTMAIVYLGLMFYYNWQLALLVMGLIPPIVILTLVATPLLRKVSQDIFNETADQNSLLVEMFTGIASVKTAATEREVRWRWEDRLTSMLNARFRGQKLANGLQVLSGLVNALGSAALLWYGAMLVIQGQLTIGQFVAFNLMLGNVITPILSIVGFWDELQEVIVSVERLNDVLTAQPEEQAGRPMLILPPIQGDVDFEKVSFRYESTEDRYTLQNVSFHVEAGQTVAIVGRSGSGKSTLVKLLQGFYPADSGRVCIDGHDVRHVSPASLRSQLGVVPQECFLFSGTVLENIQLYRSEYSLEQVIEVAKLAEANGFIQELPLGYSTKLGERGTNLSGGQRQRIAIARALLGDPAILILDEATSSLDKESERRFQKNLARLSKGRTTFIIAHQLSTVRHADLVLVLDQGILVEQGTHEDLIAQRGLYYHLAQQQLDL